MKKYICICLTFFMCAACSSHYVSRQKNIDMDQKTIAVSVSRTNKLTTQIMEDLYAQNFDVFVKNKLTDDGYSNTNSRYELFVSSYADGSCWLPYDRYTFNISVVDLTDSREVFYYSGTQCIGTINETFIKLIRNEPVE